MRPYKRLKPYVAEGWTRKQRKRNKGKRRKKAMAKRKQNADVTITPPNMQVAEFTLVGTAPYVPHKFTASKIEEIKKKQEAGSTATGKRKRAPKDFEAEALAGVHRNAKEKPGIPATAFRSAMISACRLVGFTMTRAKLAVFVEADAFDVDTAVPLVFLKGDFEAFVMEVRNATGVVDIRPRVRYLPGWTCAVRVRFDADVLTLADVANLLARAGMQVGIGDGRPDSPRSNGLGWGTWRLAEE